MLAQRPLLVGLLLSCAACSSSTPPDHDAATDAPADAAPADGTATPDAAPSDGATPDAATDDTPPPGDAGDGHSFTVQMPQVALTPAEETTQCVELHLDNPTAQLITHIHVSLAPGSHHLIFYRSTATADQLTPTPCAPLGGVTTGTAPFFIAQATESDLVMPDNVGLEIGAMQRVRIEEHFINTTAATIQGTGTVTVNTVDQGAGFTPANLMFWGTTAISIAPHSTGTADMFRLVDSGTHVFGLTAHEHHYGTLSTITEAASSADPGMELYHNTNWAEPPLTQFTPPLAFDGTQGLKLHCEYNNTSDSTVTFGESAATNEMCFFWAYYYPSHGFDIHL